MSDSKTNNPSERGQLDIADTNLATATEVSNVAGSLKTSKTSQRTASSSERQIKFERAQKCLENAALVSKRIKEHRKATAELLGRPFEEDDAGDTASEMASTMSEKTGYSVATDTSTTMSVQDALNIPGISESLANTLKQKELLMERIKQYKEISKRPMTKPATTRRESTAESKLEVKKTKPADNSDVTQLINTIKEKENSLSVIQVKMKAMETTILDLQEMINEKDQIIEAKNRATTLMSDSLSKKEKDSLDLLEDTRQQMTKMQENFIAMETEWKEEKLKLLKEIEVKDEKICSLEEANTILETARFEISLVHSKLAEELEVKNQEILSLQEKIESLSQINITESSVKEKDDVEEEKGSLEISGMVELTKKIELLEQLNCQIRQTNKELENKLAIVHTEPKSPASAAGKKGSPLPTRKGGRNTAGKVKSPWSQLSSESLPQETDKKAIKSEVARLEMLVQSLNKDILEKEYAISQKDSLIADLQEAISKFKEKTLIETVETGSCTDIVKEITKAHVHTETDPQQKELEAKVDTSNEPMDVRELLEKLKAAEEQIVILNNDIDAANKNMIKVKSSNKLKLKQLQKTIDNFSKVSDANSEIVKLNEELHLLSQKVAELEEEKGNLQLHLVDYDSGRLTDSDIYKKMVEMENLAEARLKSISVLEAQKFDLVQELHMLQQKNVEMEDKLADISQLQSEHVCTEMKSVQMEEQIDELTATKKELELVIENIKLDKEHLNETIKVLQNEKEELNHKLENYIQENMELTDKLEKLSAEKVSSAESIEIVESLTTQEKLELEEYNKGVIDDKIGDHNDENVATQTDKSIDSLIEQREELNKKIELYTLEKEEVMSKMNKIGAENESLIIKISDLDSQNIDLQNSIDKLNAEKQRLQDLNSELTLQLDNLKHERIEIVKETAEIAKPPTEDTIDGVPVEAYHDDKSAGDKGTKGAKTVKQLTKEILKLKNTIKEREDEIADCQMKILSLEEQQEKQNELLQINAANQNKIKTLSDENYNLKQQLDIANKDKEIEQQLLQLKQANELLQQELHKVNHDYAVSVGARDARINELENILLEYEKQIFNYGNNLQQKDKEMAEYINQITKLNDVSQKLKSTIELLEEEKAKDQNAELVRSLNKQINVYQKKLMENEEKVKAIEEEKHQLHCMKGDLVNKNTNLESELKKLKEAYSEKQAIIKELQLQQQKHLDEVSNIMTQTKERDEEIHEIKLQLRKESIENEKLRNAVADKENVVAELSQEIKALTEKINNLSSETNISTEQYTALESKNKELMDKLKKFAISMKKKSAMYNELEANYAECQNQVTVKNQQLEQLMIQVETLPALQEKLKHADEEINRFQSQKMVLEQQKSQEVNQHLLENKSLQEKLSMSAQEISQLHDSLNTLHRDLNFTKEENANLKIHIDILNNKLVEYDIELKNNMNLTTKISSLETDINQKQTQIDDLLNKLEQYEQQKAQVQFGYDAKVQERDLFIENLEAEISKYKNRICRLEESISIMEDRRHSLERKADQLGNQLQEKQKAYTEYTNQEDELVGRLAVLMDHDRVLEKQLIEIDNENRELQSKLQHFNEDNQRLRKALSDIQEHYNTLLDKARKVDTCETEVAKYQNQLRETEANLKKMSHEHQSLLTQKKQEIEELESEFNTQIENAFKEKKALSEKYEKINEYVAQLEAKLQEYKANIETLNVNIVELNRIHLELTSESTKKKEDSAPDYTEQYISEINKLNSIVNQKSQDIEDLNNKIHHLQTSNVAVTSNWETNLADLSTKLHQASSEMERLNTEIKSLQTVNQELHSVVLQKEEQIKELKDTKTLTFEMNIPKTEGMLISSTIEPIGNDAKDLDLVGIESQILSGEEEVSVEDKHTSKKVTEHLQKLTDQSNVLVEEPIMVAKKAYVCYKKDDKDESPIEVDPFNSDEGWGFGENEDVGEITPGFSHLNNQIQQLKKENDKLRADMETNSAKLLKALKKIKELKSANEMLTTELKIAKQMSQASFFDNAIEDELRSNIKVLESKIEELNTEINKEKRDKESLRKQNEVFHNANDRLTEMKEKLDSELELWKFKFKEANDKVSTFQWSGENKDTQSHENPTTAVNVNENKIKEDLIKIEKENDELQTIIDQLNLQNNELLAQQSSMKQEIDNLVRQLQQQKGCDNCERLSKEVLELSHRTAEVATQNGVLNESLQRVETHYKKLIEEHEQLNNDNNAVRLQLENEKTELLKQHTELEQEFVALKKLHADAEIQVSSLINNLEDAKSKLLLQEQQHVEHSKYGEESFVLQEKYHAMEQQSLDMKTLLEDANKKVSLLQIENQQLSSNSKDYQDQISELNIKIQQLNIENDSLLSTVAELRSSVSSAVDQRGFEIAELWKQHLAQREADFQKLESELRNQISASEAKYEQLLDNVQSSNQEETNKLVMMEQVTSLQNKLEDKDEHVRNLQTKCAEVMSQLDMLRSEMEDERVTNENKLLEQQEEYEKIIQDFTVKNHKQNEHYEESVRAVNNELLVLKTSNDDLNQLVENLQNKCKSLEDQVMDLSTQLRLKDSEIYQKTHDLTIALTQRNEEFEIVRQQLLEYEKKVEDLTYEKESELAVLRLKIHENENRHTQISSETDKEKKSILESLNAKTLECINLNKQIVDLNKELEEKSTKIAEMQTALENQEIEIVGLKDEIANLQSMMRSSSGKIQKHVSFASDTKAGSDLEQDNSLNKNLLDAVPRAELDLALYMLHQRDVRCEELTMELTQLLEERDTLQLRLSDSLRVSEDLKMRCKTAGIDDTFNSSQETMSELQSFTVEKEIADVHRGQTSRSSSISDLDGEKPKLQAKLSELRSVKHSRDVWLRHESEQRQLDLRLLQRDVANLPPEAVNQLAQVHHTLSRDSQSTSTVLLNWLRGKSTPKVQDM